MENHSPEEQLRSEDDKGKLTLINWDYFFWCERNELPSWIQRWMTSQTSDDTQRMRVGACSNRGILWLDQSNQFTRWDRSNASTIWYWRRTRNSQQFKVYVSSTAHEPSSTFVAILLGVIFIIHYFIYVDIYIDSNSLNYVNILKANISLHFLQQ